MLFFGISAMIVGVVVALGVGGPIWFQTVLFSVLSVVSLLTLRGPILRRMESRGAPVEPVDSFAGEQALLLSDIAPGGEGRAEVRGSTWSAQNIGDAPLTEGQTCTVDRVDGLKLFLR
jgi:membrane protein implicated in regulation of membrane protease activity